MRPHEVRVLECLANKIRAVTAEQVARLLLQPGLAASRVVRFLAPLVEKDLLSRFDLAIKLPPRLAGPSWIHVPGDPFPDFDEQARWAQRRGEVEPTLTTIYVATPKGRNLFGGDMRGQVEACQLSHELGVTEMFLAVCGASPTLEEAWRPEDLLPPNGFQEVDYDAELHSSNGDPIVALEYCGASYDADRFERLVLGTYLRRLVLELY
jgi:hypothetical protein